MQAATSKVMLGVIYDVALRSGDLKRGTIGRLRDRSKGVAWGVLRSSVARQRIATLGTFDEHVRDASGI